MKKILLLILQISILTSCSNDDDVVVGPLSGSWELISVENEAIYDAPEDEQILITFEETEYTGNTSNNDFGGDYAVVSNKLLLTNSYTTEDEDTAWGLLFYEGIQNAYNEDEEQSEFSYTLQGDRLTLRNEDEYMIFSRNE